MKIQIFNLSCYRSHELAIMRIGRVTYGTTVIKGSLTRLINQKALKFMLMQTLQEDRILQMQTMLTMYYRGLVLLYVTQTVL